MKLARRGLLGAALSLPLAQAGQSAQPPWRGALIMGTGRPGGAFAIFGPAWGQLVKNTTGIDVAYRATGGSSANLLLIDEGTAQLGLSTIAVAAQARAGTGSWTAGVKLNSFRALFPAYSSALQIISTQNGISSLAALNGVEIGVGPDGASGAAAVPAILASLGIHPSRVETSDYEEQVKGMLEGKLAACAFIGAPPLPAIAAMAMGRKLRLIGFSLAQAAQAARAVPGLSRVVLPANTFPGQNVDVGTVGTLNIAVGAASLPDNIAQAVTAAALKNRHLLSAAVPAAAQTPPVQPVYEAGISFHPGAAKALREAGFSLPRHAVQS
ncbi:MAG: TAXI family TRAP transporter solute-binding subunit [Proteobacteria bacterium]|nr:TAXI family TRAP transporter solute-binding subunit [Pseudomonadota bacterium]MBU6425014.1 TAXI family TRAP transporter solute-binding subunit [Rhodospirillales bacterium]